MATPTSARGAQEAAPAAITGGDEHLTERGGRGAVDLAVVGLGAALVVFFAGAAAVLATGSDAPTAFWAAGGAVSGGLLGLLVPPPSSPDPNVLASSIAGNAVQTAAVQAAKRAADRLPESAKAAGTKALARVDGIGEELESSLDSAARRGDTPASAARRGATIAGLAHRVAADDSRRAADAASEQLEPFSNGERSDPSASKAAEDAHASSTVADAAADAAGAAQASATDTAVAAVSMSGPATLARTATWLFMVFVALLALGIVLAAGAVTPPKSFGSQALENVTTAVLALASAAGTGLIGLWIPTPTSGRRESP
jgi:hypothetical protein